MVANVVLTADMVPVGLADAAKKPDGSQRDVAASSKLAPALVVNENVAAALVSPRPGQPWQQKTRHQQLGLR